MFFEKNRAKKIKILDLPVCRRFMVGMSRRKMVVVADDVTVQPIQLCGHEALLHLTQTRFRFVSVVTVLNSKIPR